MSAQVAPDSGMMDIDVDLDLDFTGYEPPPQDAAMSNPPLTTDAPAGESGPSAEADGDAEPAEFIPTKVFISGLDDLSTKDITSYCRDHNVSFTRIEWINDASAKLVFESVEDTGRALAALTGYEISQLDSINWRELHPAATYSSDEHPNVELSVRLANVSDNKRPQAHRQSRYYFLHPEADTKDLRLRRELEKLQGRNSNRDQRRQPRSARDAYDSSASTVSDNDSALGRRSNTTTERRQGGQRHRDRSRSPGSYNSKTRRGGDWRDDDADLFSAADGGSRRTGDRRSNRRARADEEDDLLRPRRSNRSDDLLRPRASSRDLLAPSQAEEDLIPSVKPVSRLDGLFASRGDKGKREAAAAAAAPSSSLGGDLIKPSVSDQPGSSTELSIKDAWKRLAPFKAAVASSSTADGTGSSAPKSSLESRIKLSGQPSSSSSTTQPKGLAARIVVPSSGAGQKRDLIDFDGGLAIRGSASRDLIPSRGDGGGDRNSRRRRAKAEDFH